MMKPPAFSPLAVLKWCSAIACAYWLQFSSPIRVLIVLMTIDYLSGFVAAVRTRTVSSSVGWWGLVVKLMTLLLLLACHLVEQLLGAEWRIEVVGAVGYCINETVSIIENSARIGVPIPARVISAMADLKKLLRSDPATPEQLRRLEKGE